MKKGLLLVLIGMSLLLSGCAKTATPEVEDETVDTPIQETGEVNHEAYVGETLAKYGKEVEKTDFVIENQRPNKRFVLIKEPKENGRPLITKFVYLEENEKLTPLFIMVDNETQFGTDSE